MQTNVFATRDYSVSHSPVRKFRQTNPLLNVITFTTLDDCLTGSILLPFLKVEEGNEYVFKDLESYLSVHAQWQVLFSLSYQWSRKELVRIRQQSDPEVAFVAEQTLYDVQTLLFDRMYEVFNEELGLPFNIAKEDNLLTFGKIQYSLCTETRTVQAGFTPLDLHRNTRSNAYNKPKQLTPSAYIHSSYLVRGGDQVDRFLELVHLFATKAKDFNVLYDQTHSSFLSIEDAFFSWAAPEKPPGLRRDTGCHVGDPDMRWGCTKYSPYAEVHYEASEDDSHARWHDLMISRLWTESEFSNILHEVVIQGLGLGKEHHPMSAARYRDPLQDSNFPYSLRV